MKSKKKLKKAIKLAEKAVQTQDDILNNKTTGKSGDLITSNVHGDEYLAELVGVEAHDRYDRMRKSDTQVIKLLSAISSPIKGAKWSIEPSSSEDKDMEIANLIDHIIFKDLRLKRKMAEICTFIPHGFALFEKIFINKTDPIMGSYTTLANMAFRYQGSITEWEYDKVTSDLSKVRQVQSGDLEIDAWLDAVNLAIFYNDKEGSRNGTPILRGLYGPYKRKLASETCKMVGIERSAVGTPSMKVPKGVKSTSNEYTAARQILTQYVSAKIGFIMHPEGWDLDLNKNGGFDPMKVEDSIKREDEKMAGALLAAFLELGTGGNGGAYALGDNLKRFFMEVIASFADVIVDVMNEIIEVLVRANYGPQESYPTLSYSGITEATGLELMRIITGYTNAQVIKVDERLEDHVRKAHHLPKKEEGEAIDNSSADGAYESAESSEAETQEPEVQESDDAIAASENIKLADKTARGLMKTQQESVEELMQRNLSEIGSKMVADIIAKYKKLPESKKTDAIKDIKVGGTAKYKRQLTGALSQTAKKSLDQVAGEVPSDKKLSEIKGKLYDADKVYKFAKSELSGLPPQVKDLVQLQSNRIVDRQTSDLEDRVAFTFMQRNPTTNDYAVMESELNKEVKSYVDSGAVRSGASNSVATVVNQSRLEYFFDKEVVEEIYAFRFTNVDPKSSICKTLAGRVFAKDDYEFLSYQPPLHHGCKSYLDAVLQTQKTKPEIEPLPPISEQDRKSVTLGE